MEEKINYWAEIWDEEISEVYNGKSMYWFTIESKSILRSSIEMLEKLTKTKVFSIDINDDGKMEIWLQKRI